VFRYFPAEPAPLDPHWKSLPLAGSRVVRSVTFNSFDGIRARALLSLPQGGTSRLPALLVIDHRKGIRVWGNEQPLEANQWGKRAVLIVETLDRGTRALEQNLRSFVDNDALHHMKRQAMIAGTTIESMQVYEILRSIDLLRSLPEVDGSRITVTGRFEDGVNGLYASLLDGNIQKVILGSPPTSHLQGPHYLGVLRHTDIPDVIKLMGARVNLYGETARALSGTRYMCGSLAMCLTNE
jgi:cephalosporin-C deacetylase-like acetyl esterase